MDYNATYAKKNKEENTQHIFECSAYEDLWTGLKERDSLVSIINNNKTKEIARTINNILTRREEFLKMEPTTAPLHRGSSLPDGSE